MLLSYHCPITNFEKIYFGGKHIGNVKPVEGGFQYFPENSDVGGCVFSSLSECLKHIENN